MDAFAAFAPTGWLLNPDDFRSSTLLLLSLVAVGAVAGILFWSGVVDAVLWVIGVVVRGGTAIGFRASWPLFLAVQFALLALGLEAVERAEQFRPAFVLMDIGMPRLNGLEATKRIREQPWGQRMTIIALTGWGQDADRERTHEAGCNGHLVKPVSMSDLQRVLAEVSEAGAVGAGKRGR
jgi:CheY-like chemotaxis protein